MDRAESKDLKGKGTEEAKVSFQAYLRSQFDISCVEPLFLLLPCCLEVAGIIIC